MDRVDARKVPALYHLVALDGKALPSPFYAEELSKVSRAALQPGKVFRVKNIIDEKEENGNKYYLVNFADYEKIMRPRWVKESDLLK